MSHTTVRDCTPDRKPGDDAVIIVVGEEGMLSVDPDLFDSLLASSNADTEVSVVRMSNEDPETGIVEAVVDTFYDNQGIGTNKITEPLTMDLSTITQMYENVHLDHCYTPLTSPSQKRDKSGLDHAESNLETTSANNLNNSTDDLVAVLSAFENDSVKLPENNEIATAERTLSQSLVKPNVNKVKVQKVSSVNKKNTFSRKLKILSVAKPDENQSLPDSEQMTSGKIKQKKKSIASTLKNIMHDDFEDEHGGTSSDSDFIQDEDDEDDSADSDFDVSHPSVNDKPKYIKKSYVKREKPEKIQKSPKLGQKKILTKKVSFRKDKGSIPKLDRGNKIKILSDIKLQNAVEKVDIPTTPVSEILNVAKSPVESAKKIVKKKPPKPLDIFDDGIALFSTPDVIRRVSLSGSQKSNESGTERTPDIPENKSIRSLSTEIKALDNLERIDDKPVLNLDNITKEKLHADIQKQDEKDMINDTSLLEHHDHNLVNMNLDNSNLDLDLNAEELIPEDLLFQVAKLVENTVIQKVIDTNLNLVDQHVPDIEPDVPTKGTEEESYSAKEIMTGENMTTPSIKDIQKIIGGDLSNVSIVTDRNDKNQFEGEHKIIHPDDAHLVKNTMNKPIQIVRPDGRVITIPPIEKPATRSSKRKQDDVKSPIKNKIPEKSLLVKSKPTPEIATKRAPGTTPHEELVHHEVLPTDDQIISDSDESWKSEDDPDRLWCICKQPHNNRFMICCDTCEEWFHGQCVGISKATGRQMELQGKEWQCPNCVKNKKSALQEALDEAHVALSTTAQVAELPPKYTGTGRCIVCKGPSRSESVYCSEKCIVQHSNSIEKVIVYERATGRCLSGSNAPTLANLKQWLKEHPGFEVVSSGNKALTQSKLQFTKSGKLGISMQQRKLPTDKVLSPKPMIKKGIISKLQPGEKAVLQKGISQQSFYSKQNPDQQGRSILKAQIIGRTSLASQIQAKSAKLIQPLTIVPKTPTLKLKVINATPTLASSPAQPVVKHVNKPAVTPQKVSRQKSTAEKHVTTPTFDKSPANAKGPEQLRDNVRKTLAEHLNIRIKEQNDIVMSEDEVKQLSTEIETELCSLFNKDTGAKYRSRYRSLIFNIKDTKNTTLWKRIIKKTLTPHELVRLSPEELASQELAQWRERETKHQLEMIKKSELDLLNCARTYVLKSHKGEEVIEKKSEVDSTIVAELDGTITEDSQAIENAESLKKDGTKSSLLDKDKHKGSSSSKHKSSRDGKEKNRENRNKHDDRKKRSRSRSKDRHTSDKSKKSRHRSRSRTRHALDQDSHKHKDKHRDDGSRHKSTSSRHKSRHKDSGSDSTSNKSFHKNSESNKSSLSDCAETLDKRSKEILEGLVDNKIVAPLEDRLWKHVQEHDMPVASNCDSESDHEPSSTVTISTPPRSAESDIDKSIAADRILSISDKKDIKTTPSDVTTDTSSVTVTKTSADGPNVWTGHINMVDVAKFYITAQEVSGDCVELASELPQVLDIVGRISPDTVWDYLSKMKRSTAKQISVLRLTPANDEEHMPYHALYTYLNSRKRFGVIKTTDTAIKDFYIMPLASFSPLPDILRSLSGPGFEESKPHLLLGILVSTKRKRPLLTASGSSNVSSVLGAPPAKRSKESPPRSYTPPLSGGTRVDPRIKPQVLPPLPLVEESSVDTKTTPTDDDDEPYSPGDSDEGELSTPIASKPFVSTEAPKQPVSDLSSFEPFKAVTFSTIPGLETTATMNTLGISNLLTNLVSVGSTSESTDTKINPSSSFLTTPAFPTELGTIDQTDLQKKMDELNKQIEREKQQIESISQGIARKEDIGTSCLANIALPSNLQQILDSIKTINPNSVDADVSQSAISEYTSSLPDLTKPPPPLPVVGDQGQPALPTIPLILPKINTRLTESSSKVDLTIPLNLPRPKRSDPRSRKDPLLSIPLNLPKVTKKSAASKSDTKQSASVLSSLSEEELIRKAAEMLGTETESKTEIPKTDVEFESVKNVDENQSDGSKQKESVLSTLSEEELIRKAAEMLGETEIQKEEKKPTPPNSPQPAPSFKQAPLMFTQNKKQKLIDISQPPVPGLEDYDEEI